MDTIEYWINEVMSEKNRMSARIIYLTDDEFELMIGHLGLEKHKLDTIHLEHKLIFMRDKLEEKAVLSKPTMQELFNILGMTNDDLIEAHNRKYSPMPTKAKMTRAEAIKVMEKHLPFSNNVEKVIDFYVEAGMLDIVEEEKLPVFEIILNNLDQTHIKIYENGKVEGISGTIINRMPSCK